MKALCLLAVVVGSLAGCASAPETDALSKRERVADEYVPVGTAIPRKRSQQGVAPAGEADKQALENDRMMSSATVNSR